MKIRPIDAENQDEQTLVAERMRLTLEEVLGAERGGNYYSMEWLRNRLLQHLDPEQNTAQVLLAEDADDGIQGHTIVRVEQDEQGQPFGLYSTTYVVPEARRRGVANLLVEAGEEWLLAQGMRRLATDTARGNGKLIHLFERRGYHVVLKTEEMLRLQKDFA